MLVCSVSPCYRNLRALPPPPSPLVWSDQVTSTSLVNLPATLRVLRLRRNEGMSEPAVGQIAARCPSLETLELVGFTNLGPREFFSVPFLHAGLLSWMQHPQRR